MRKYLLSAVAASAVIAGFIYIAKGFALGRV